MEPKPIETEEEYNTLLEWVNEQFDRKTPPNGPDGQLVQKALLLIKAYEDEHYKVAD